MKKENKIYGTILITGGTGSWGYQLTKNLLNQPQVKKIIILSRNEHKQVEMERQFQNKKIKFVICDIRAFNNLIQIIQNVDVVFHLAAMKHVHICEENSWQTVETNIIGTQNVIRASIEANIRLLVDISTDKAVEPHNIYGVSKSCGEKLIVNAQHNYISNTSFICVRAGNVVGTNGSIFPLFKKQLLNDNIITVTNPEMTRFIMKTEDAIELIFHAVQKSIGGEIFVMKMPSVRIKVIADAMISYFGNKNSKIKIIGERPGEKLHEKLLSSNEIRHTYELDEKYYVILPEIVNKNKFENYKKLKRVSLTDYSSLSGKFLTHNQLIKIIKSEEKSW